MREIREAARLYFFFYFGNFDSCSCYLKVKNSSTAAAALKQGERAFGVVPVRSRLFVLSLVVEAGASV